MTEKNYDIQKFNTSLVCIIYVECKQTEIHLLMLLFYESFKSYRG